MTLHVVGCMYMPSYLVRLSPLRRGACVHPDSKLRVTGGLLNFAGGLRLTDRTQANEDACLVSVI